MAVIVTLLPHAGHLQRLRYAIRDRHEIVKCDDWVSVARACDRMPVRVAVLDLFADGSAAFDRARRIKERHPRLAMVAYITATLDRAHDIFDAGRYGFDAMIIGGVNDEPRPLLATIEQAEARSLTSLLRKALADVSPTVTDAILLSVTRAHERLSPDGLARLLAIPRRTLSRRLSDEGFPAPLRLLTWGRLIVAGHMLEDEHRSADRIARALGFPSGSAFRNTCQRYLHSTPGDVRARGGAAFVTRALLRQRTRPLSHDPARPRIATRSPAVAV